MILRFRDRMKDFFVFLKKCTWKEKAVNWSARGKKDIIYAIGKINVTKRGFKTGEVMKKEAVIEVKNMCKNFGPTKALRNVDV